MFFKKIFLLSIIVFSSGFLFGQSIGDYRTTSDAPWSALTTWQRWNGSWQTPTSAEGYPGQYAVPALVTILNADDITLDVSPANSIGALIINAGNSSSSIVFSGTHSLTVDGAITINSGTGNGDNKFIAVNAGSLTGASLALANVAGAANKSNSLRITTGNVTVLGAITMADNNPAQNFVAVGTGILNVGGNVTGGTVTTSTGSIVNYNGADQTIRAVTYSGDLTLSGSGLKTITGVTTLGGNFTLSGSATTAATGALSIGGTVTLGSGTTFTAGGFTHNVGGNWVNNGATFNNTGSTIAMNRGGVQSIGGSGSTTFNNLTLSGTGTKTLGVATVIAGNLSINTNAVANLGTLTTHTANTLILGGVNQISGTWGSTSSAAVHTSNTFFVPTTGIVTIAATNFYSRANGAWNLNTTWSLSSGGPAVGVGIFPTSGDLVTIERGYTVTVTAGAACASLSYNNVGNNSSSVTINSGVTLNVTGLITIPRANGGANINTLAVGAGILNAGSIAFTNGGGTIRHQLTISTGTVSVAGDITTDNTGSSASILFTGAGALNAGVGILTTGINGGTLTTFAGSTINYNGAAQTIKNVNYLGNLILSGSGIKTLQAGTTTLGGNFSLSGTASTSAVVALTITGNVTLGSGTSFTAGAFTHNVAGNWVNNGATFTNTGSTISMNRVGAQSIGGSSSTTFNNLTLTSTGVSTKTLSVSTIIAGTLSITGAGTVKADLSTITTHTANSLILNGANQASGTWGSSTSAATNKSNTWFANTGIIAITSATFYSRASSNWTINTTWSFSPTGSPAVGAGIFPKANDIVNITGGSNVTVTANAACASLTYVGAGVNNTITINPGVSLSVSGAITIPRANNGFSNTMAVGAGTLTAGSIAFTSGGGASTRHQLTLSTGTVTVSGDITTSSAGASALILFTGAGTLNAGVGILTTGLNGGTLTTFTGSTINYTGAAQTIKAVNYLGNLTLSGSGAKTLGAGTTTIGGNFSLSGTASTSAVGALTITGNVTLGAGTSLTAGVFTHNVAGNWVNNGATFNHTGSTITMNRGGVQSIGGSGSTTFNHLTLAGTGTKTFSIATFIAGNLAINTNAVVNLGAITTHTANSLILGGANQASGSWGSTTSAATHTNNTFFAATTGIVNVTAASFYSRATGAWNSNTTWSFSSGGPAVGVGIFPTSGDLVTIERGYTVTVTAGAACASLSYNNVGNNSSSVTLNSGVTLNVTGAITLPRATGGGNINTLVVGAGILNAGSIAFTNGGGAVRHQLTISTGTVSVAGDITTNNAGNGASIIFTGAGTLNAGVGILTTGINGGTLTTFAGSTINYNGTAQTVKDVNYLGNLILSGNGDKTLLAGTTNIGGNLTLSGSAATTAIGALSIGGTVTLGLGTTFTAGAFTHLVAGDWINDGTFTAETGTVAFTGTGIQNIQGSSITTFNNININNALAFVNVQSSQHLQGILTLAPSAKFDADGTSNTSVFTLLSTNSVPVQDAAIAAIPGSATFTGDVTIQRFMQNGGNINRYIASPIANMAVSQLDFTKKNGSIKYYDESVLGDIINGYKNLALTGSFATGRGYLAYMYSAADITWDAVGSIHQGSISLPVSYTSSSGGVDADGWNLVGNPYPSGIVWESGSGWSLTNIDAVISVPDLSILTGYPTYYHTSNFNDNSGDLPNDFIAMGQAFWVHASAGGASLSVNESAKKPTIGGSFYRKASPSSEQLIISINNGQRQDRAFLKLNQDATDGYDQKFDGYKLKNEEMNIYLLDDEQRQLVMHTLSDIPVDMQIALGMEVMKAGEYEITFANVDEFSLGTELYLIDRFENKAVPVSSEQGYAISVNDISKPVTDRFYLSRNPDISERNLSELVQVYPNPVKDKLTIHLPSNEVGTIKMTDYQGREFLSTQIKESHEIDMSGYAPGMYVLRIFTKGEVVVHKIIR